MPKLPESCFDGFEVFSYLEAIKKFEFDRDTGFKMPPRWMNGPWPWNWFVTARRTR